MAIVEISHLSHVYDRQRALDDVSLSVEPGAVQGFLGPNGSGKTTLFRILSTLISPQPPGEVKILEMDLGTEQRRVRLSLGVVFQSPSLDRQLTARENLRQQGHLYGLGGADLESRIDLLLERVGLRDRQREYVGAFSGGMRRRVELAKGLLNRPRVLLLDEPSTGLDPTARIDLWRYLRDIRDHDGVTILVTTHLMDEAEHCSRLAILDRGKLLANDTPAALKDRIGGDVIALTTARPDELREQLRARFSIEAEPIEHQRGLRFERPRGHEFIPQLIEAFPGLIDSVSVGKPTLEDVFIQVTGHGLDGEIAGAGADTPVTVRAS